MPQSIKLVGLHFEHIEAHVFLRKKKVEAEVTIGIDDVSVTTHKPVPPGDAPVTSIEKVTIQYKHYVSAKTTEDEKFYDASVILKLVVDVDRAVHPSDGDMIAFLDEALAYGLPASAQKLRELCTTIGISPAPTFQLTPERVDEDHDANDAN